MHVLGLDPTIQGTVQGLFGHEAFIVSYQYNTIWEQGCLAVRNIQQGEVIQARDVCEEGFRHAALSSDGRGKAKVMVHVDSVYMRKNLLSYSVIDLKRRSESYFKILIRFPGL